MCLITDLNSQIAARIMYNAFVTNTVTEDVNKEVLMQMHKDLVVNSAVGVVSFRSDDSIEITKAILACDEPVLTCHAQIVEVLNQCS